MKRNKRTAVMVEINSSVNPEEESVVLSIAILREFARKNGMDFAKQRFDDLWLSNDLKVTARFEEEGEWQDDDDDDSGWDADWPQLPGNNN